MQRSQRDTSNEVRATWPDAIYTESPLVDYRGNPFIEALPPIRSNEEFVRFAQSIPQIGPGELSLPAQYRIHCVKRLSTLRLPTDPMIRLNQELDIALRHGYVARNPAKLEARQALYTGTYGISLNDEADPACELLVGLSGVGKSTILRSILSQYPQAIVHHRITRGLLQETQLVWLKVDCPHDAGLFGLCLRICEEIDRVLGTDFKTEWRSGHDNIENRLSSIIRVLNNLHLGVLVLDELQHLKAAKAGGAEKLLNFLVNLINAIKLPLVLTGTYALEKVLEKQMRNGRRASGAGAITVPRLRMEDAMWRLLLEKMWLCQWVLHPVPLSAEIEGALYDCSMGIWDTVIKVFQAAQIRAITDQSEIVTADTIRAVYKSGFYLLHEAHGYLREGRQDDDPVFEDLYLTLDKQRVKGQDVDGSSHVGDSVGQENRASRKRRGATDRNGEFPLKKECAGAKFEDLRDLDDQGEREQLARYNLLDKDCQSFALGEAA